MLSEPLTYYLESGFPNEFITTLLKEINVKINIKSREKFYASYYTNIVHTNFCIDKIPNKNLKIVLMKLGDLLWVSRPIKDNVDLSEKMATDQPVSEKEIDSLQYLGGYVLHI